MMPPPFNVLAMIAGQPEPDISAAPDNIDWKSADEAPMKIGSSSMPYFSERRASLATNHGRQLRPIGENGKGTFFSACAWDELGKKSEAAIIKRVSLQPALKNRQEDGKSSERFISNPPLCVRLLV